MKPAHRYATATAFRIALEARLKSLAQAEGIDLQRLSGPTGSADAGGSNLSHGRVLLHGRRADLRSRVGVAHQAEGDEPGGVVAVGDLPGEALHDPVGVAIGDGALDVGPVRGRLLGHSRLAADALQGRDGQARPGGEL